VSKISAYWDSHYTFERESSFVVKTLGKAAIYLILINGMAPLLFLFGTKHNQPVYTERTLAMLEEIPAEKNSMISSWAQHGVHARNALETQALKQLKNCYCDHKRCLECRIGTKLLNKIQY